MATRFVSPSGDNGNDGLSVETAFETLDYAKANADVGDAIRDLDGDNKFITITAKFAVNHFVTN